MEYYRRCNVCGDIFCYTTSDLKNNLSNSLVSSMAAVGSVANAFSGDRYDMYEMGKISNRAGERVINYQKCSRCGSIDTYLVTKKFAQYVNKVSNVLDENYMIEEAKKYLANSDYENAFCFANGACLENENSFNGYLIKFLAAFNIKTIEDVLKIEIDFSTNVHYINLYNCSDNKFRCQLSLLCNDNKKRILRKEAKKLLKSDLDLIKIEKIIKLKDLMFDNDLSEEADYKKLVKYIENRRKKDIKRMKDLKEFSIIFIAGFTIFIIAAISSNQANKYKDIMNLINNGEYYEAMSNYYEKLNVTNKKKINKYFIEKINKYIWVGDREVQYKGRNNVSCLSKKYISFDEDNNMITYIDCMEDGYEELEEQYTDKRELSLKIDEEKDSVYGVYRLNMSGTDYYLNFFSNGFYITYESYYTNTGNSYIHTFRAVNKDN